MVQLLQLLAVPLRPSVRGVRSILMLIHQAIVHLHSNTMTSALVSEKQVFSNIPHQATKPPSLLLRRFSMPQPTYFNLNLLFVIIPIYFFDKSFR
jgi:hypothetical protein